MPTTPLQNLEGRKFGRWLVLEYATKSRWMCICECGMGRIVPTSNLLQGKSKSCGCYREESCRQTFRKHGLAQADTSPLHRKAYNARRAIIRRCYSANLPDFPNYGGRGITMCERWLNSVEAFIQDMGLPPSTDHSIERLDVNAGYFPGNCIWATRAEQARNKRTSVRLTWRGETRHVLEWAEIVGVCVGTLRARVARGWDAERILTTPA